MRFGTYANVIRLTMWAAPLVVSSVGSRWRVVRRRLPAAFSVSLMASVLPALIL